MQGMIVIVIWEVPITHVSHASTIVEIMSVDTFIYITFISNGERVLVVRYRRVIYRQVL